IPILCDVFSFVCSIPFWLASCPLTDIGSPIIKNSPKIKCILCSLYLIEKCNPLISRFSCEQKLKIIFLFNELTMIEILLNASVRKFLPHKKREEKQVHLANS